MRADPLNAELYDGMQEPAFGVLLAQLPPAPQTGANGVPE
jgi:hypothetical protein